MDEAVLDRMLQRFCHAHHHQEVAVRQPGQRRVERAEDKRFDPKVPRQRRLTEIDVIGDEDKLIDGVVHFLACMRGERVSCCTTVRRGCVSR